MGILATLKKDGAGQWPSLPDYLREAHHRETSSLAALSLALSAPAEEQKELAGAPGAAGILLELACDLRVPKGARLAAARCLLEGGASGLPLGQLFLGAGDLVTDPRLGSAARKLVDGGLPEALRLPGEPAQVSLAAGAFARAVQAAASAAGKDRTLALLAGAPQGHAGVAAGRYALGEAELPADQLDAWKKLLDLTCAKNRSAPAAARRMGMAPPWPPNLPDAFAPLLREAEQKNQGVVSADAAKGPELLKKLAPEAPAPPPPPGKTLAPPIRRSPFKKPIGAVMEVPAVAPPKAMDEVKGRATSPAPAQRPKVEVREEAPVPTRAAPLPIAALPSRQQEDLRFDPKGHRIPRADRWRDDRFEWDVPVLPSSELPPPPRVAVAQGPFTQRLRSIFENRPEAVDRLCAAAEARKAVAGEEQLARELSAELDREEWKNQRLPFEQLLRLSAVTGGPAHPGPWRLVAQLLLDRLGKKK